MRAAVPKHHNPATSPSPAPPKASQTASQRSMTGPISSPASVRCAGQEAAERVLKAAIHRGAPIYNRGDHAGCAQIYASAAEEAVQVAGDDGETCAMLRAALQQARLSATPTSAAWALRHAFDAINNRPSLKSSRVLVSSHGSGLVSQN